MIYELDFKPTSQVQSITQLSIFTEYQRENMIVYLKHIKIGNNHLDSLSSDDMEVDSDTGGIPILEELGLVSQRDEQGEQGEQNEPTWWSLLSVEKL